MKYTSVVTLAYLACGSALYANCMPPMQILFSCTLEDTDARVEFCHEILEESSANSSSIPGHERSYSFARGIEPTELYFTPTTSFFTTIDATAIDKKIHGSGVDHFLAIGYENVDYVYAALLPVDESFHARFSSAEIRVFENADKFQKMQAGDEVGRYFCEPGSVIVDQYEFRP